VDRHIGRLAGRLPSPPQRMCRKVADWMPMPQESTQIVVHHSLTSSPATDQALAVSMGGARPQIGVPNL
jgi:hypothetical protein